MTRYTARGRDRTRLHGMTGALSAYHAVHHRLDATLGFLATIAGNDGQRAATTDPSGTGSHTISDPTGTNATTPKPPDDHEKLIRALGQATRGLDDIAAIIRNNDPDRTVIATDPHCGHELPDGLDQCRRGCHDTPEKRTCANPNCRWHTKEIPANVKVRKGGPDQARCCNTCGMAWARNGQWPTATVASLIDAARDLRAEGA